MLTQISFTADQGLKEQTMKKTKEKGITLKSVLVLSMKAFVEGKIDLGLVGIEEEEVEELYFDSSAINEKAKKLAILLK